MKAYGKLSSEKFSEENEQCREIVQEIVNFGISDRQKLLVMYLLALDIEDVEKMQNIASFFKEFYGSEIFLTEHYESENENGTSST
jgi:hypothetical protein